VQSDLKELNRKDRKARREQPPSGAFTYTQAMLILMAGLPGTGKSTLSRALAAEFGGSVLDKDQIRAALFPASDIEYSTEQDDFCMAIMLKVAGYIFRKEPSRCIFLDGRTFSRKYQLRRATGYAEAIGQPWRILECVCSEQSARDRLAHDPGHVAANRDFNLYLEVKAGFEEIVLPKIVIDTDQPLERCVERAKAGLVVPTSSLVPPTP
jgi:predicted kinase